MAYNYYLLDTFTNEKFKGNPTPVCLLDGALDSQTMHDFAKEFNAPVTAFVEAPNIKSIYRIRYFTVTGEIPACGHATLGAAFVLLNELKGNEVIFETIEKVQVRTRQENDLTLIEYPKYASMEFEISQEMKRSLGIVNHESHFFCKELESLFIELKMEKEVINIAPDFRMLMESTDKVKEVVVMSESESQNYDFTLRSFCPWIGIDEDPVTGSVHSVLGPYWKEKLNKDKLIAFQASKRGGLLNIRPSKERVEIGGYSKIVLKGNL